MRLLQVPTPLRVPPELRELMVAYPAEYGSHLGVPEEMPSDFAWHVADDDETILGFAWVTRMTCRDTPHGFYLDLAILERFQGRGAGRFALAQVERALSEAGVPELFMQVNNINPRTGLRVRRWLLASGFRVTARDEVYPEYNDEQYALRVAMPVYFSKQLRGRDDGTAAG